MAPSEPAANVTVAPPSDSAKPPIVTDQVQPPVTDEIDPPSTEAPVTDAETEQSDAE